MYKTKSKNIQKLKWAIPIQNDGKWKGDEACSEKQHKNMFIQQHEESPLIGL